MPGDQLMRIIIAGGGASGLMAALASKMYGAEVLILEKNGEIGKKILSTGNGRCNLTNEIQTGSCYRSARPENLRPVFEQFSKDDTISFFEENGLHLKQKHGYYYPRNAQALSVREFLRELCQKAGVEIKLHKNIVGVSERGGRGSNRESGKGFQVFCEDGSAYTCDRLILAAGGMAAPKTGSDGGGYKIAEKLGHTLVTPVPALTSLYVKKEEADFFKKAAGIRTDGQILLKTEDVYSDSGEIQLVEYGLSGIPAFNVSGPAARAIRAGKRVWVEVNFLPEIPEHVLEKQFADYRDRFPENTLRMWLSGYLAPKLSEALLFRVKLPPALYMRRCTGQDAAGLIAAVRKCRFEVEKTGGFDKAQVTSGGVDLSEVNMNTLESNTVPGLYFAGEILDVDGICGGYNLQWAWSSGYIAGRHAAESMR